MSSFFYYYYLFTSLLPLKIQLSRVEGLVQINQFNSATLLWFPNVSNAIYHSLVCVPIF